MDNLTPKQHAKIRSKWTKPERLLMQALRKEGIYFSTHAKNIIGCPDVVFRRKKIVVFVDSDFWHGHPIRFIIPKTNPLYWSNKIQKNKERDKLVTKSLKTSGWRVIRLWEYDLYKHEKRCIRKIINALEMIKIITQTK